MQTGDLKKKYIKEVLPKLKEKFGYKNELTVPKIKKVIVNTGFNIDVSKDKKILDAIINDLAAITGQKPVSTQAKKAIAGFKTRQGMVVGLKTTLRGNRMFNFVSRLINTALPRTRDFRGLSPRSIDDGGNLSIGIKEHIIFPEVSQEGLKRSFGLEVTIVSDAKTKQEALELFILLGFPIKHG